MSGTKPAADSEAFLYLLSTLASGTFGAPQAIITGTVVAGTSIWTPPTGYVPNGAVTRQDIECIVETGTEAFNADYPRFDMEPSGLLAQNMSALMTRVGWNDSYALD